jgi:ParB family chromosome partitioning protein
LVEEFHLTQEEIAARVGKSRSLIANTLRLLQLPQEARELLARGILSAGHGKVLLGLPSPEQQCALAQEIVSRGLSVRETEKEARRLIRSQAGPARPKEKRASLDPELDEAEAQLQRLLGTKVRIKTGPRGGKIEIEFYSKDELDRLLEWFTGDLSR